MPPKKEGLTAAEIQQMANDKRLNPPVTADELRTLLALGSTESVGTELDVMKLSRQEAKKAAAGKKEGLTAAEIQQMANDKRLNPPVTADELRTLLALGSTESVGTELDVMKLSRQEAKKAAAGTAKTAAGTAEKQKVNTMTFDKVRKCVEEVNKDMDTAGPKLVLTSDEMKTALAYNGEEETMSNLKLLKMTRKEAAQNKKTQLLPIPDLPSNMTVATTGDFKRIPYPDMLGEMGVTEEKVGGAIDSNGQKSVSVSKLDAAHLAQLIFDNKLCNAYRPLPDLDFSGISSVRADKSAIQIVNTSAFRDQLFIQAPQDSVQMSQFSSAHSGEAHSQKSLAVSASVSARWEMFSADVGGGHSSSSSSSSKDSAFHSIAQIKVTTMTFHSLSLSMMSDTNPRTYTILRCAVLPPSRIANLGPS